MREHEVPTHVQAEDRVILGLTFPQIVAITAVCALSYGAYRYAPVGPSEVRMTLAVLFGLAGVAMIVGKIGGRRLPLVAADLLKYRLGARVHAGPVSQLVRSEPPAPVQPVWSGGRSPAADGEEVAACPPQAAQEEEQAEGPPQRAEAIPSPRLVREAPPQVRHGPSRLRPQGRDAGVQAAEAPQGIPFGRRRRRPCGGGGDGPPGRPGRRPLAGRD